MVYSVKYNSVQSSTKYLHRNEFDTNVTTIPNSSAVVEFAVKLPHDDEGFIYLPIDSKFPLDAYNDLLNAYDTGDSEIINRSSKALVQRIKQFAKIFTKIR